MAQDSEKKFHSIMDRLFHPSKSTPSTSDAQTSRGKKRANPSSALALIEPKFNSVVEASPLSSKAPLCRPWHRGDLMKRLSTFKSMTWFAKPEEVSALNCARRGWINVDMDIIACEACQARLLFSTPSSWNQQQVEKAALVFSLKLDSGHKLLCPWIDNTCDEKLAQFPPTQHPILVDKFRDRFSALLQLSALPLISSSAIEYMKNPQLEQFLEQSLTQEYGNVFANISRPEYLGNECDADSAKLYYQAQKLISLCGWEPRSLPYFVDNENRSNSSSLKANICDLSDLAANGQNKRIYELMEGDENHEASNVVQSDPNSVVLDCSLCGATVGLWAFSTVQQPTEYFEIVGCTELHTENHSVIHDSGTENRRDMTSGGLKDAMLSKERLSNLNLTIAGGPPPTKQNFKATISLPVIGRNLRARFSNDSEFRDRIFFNQGKGYTSEKGDTLSKENDCNKSMEGTEVNGQAIQPDDGMHDFLMGSLSLPNETQENCQGDVMLLENEGNVGFKSSAEEPANSHVTNSSLTTAGDIAKNIIGENDRNDLSLIVSSSNGNLLQISGSNVVDNDDTPLTGHQESCSEANVDVGKTSTDTQTALVAQANSQEGIGEKIHTPVNNELAVFSSGKDHKQVPLDKAMEFDPIRQHRHFCPWIASTGNGTPGWRQTLNALQRQKGFSPSSPKNSPSSASIMKVDDPLTSVRNLFMSPSIKKLKRTLFPAQNSENQ